jgi:hypothetical protein
MAGKRFIRPEGGLSRLFVPTKKREVLGEHLP